MKQILNQIYSQKPLSYKQAKQVLIEIGKGEHNNSQVSAFISSYSLRYITIEELCAFKDAMVELCLSVDLAKYQPIDLVGTGGDEKNTFNISTLSAILSSCCGARVAKHGNYGVSSVCGSSLGIVFTNDETKLRAHMEKVGICFLHAQLFHPAMKFIAPIRKELGVRTFFNILGPLVNPAAKSLIGQFNGVFSLETMRLYNYILQNESNNYAVVYSLDGYDEISLTGAFKLITAQSEKVYDASYFSFSPVKAEDLYGGDSINQSAEIFIKIAKGEGSEAQNNAIIANTALALQRAFPNEALESLISRAKNNLIQGAVYKKVQAILDLQTRLN